MGKYGVDGIKVTGVNLAAINQAGGINDIVKAGYGKCVPVAFDNVKLTSLQRSKRVLLRKQVMQGRPKHSASADQQQLVHAVTKALCNSGKFARSEIVSFRDNLRVFSDV